MIGKQLLDLGERLHRRVLDATDCRSRGRSQPDCDCHGLVVVEHERWQVCSGCEPVSAVGARRGVDRVTQVAQSVDVAADGALGDLQALGEFGATPQPVGLQ